MHNEKVQYKCRKTLIAVGNAKSRPESAAEELSVRKAPQSTRGESSSRQLHVLPVLSSLFTANILYSEREQQKLRR